MEVIVHFQNQRDTIHIKGANPSVVQLRKEIAKKFPVRTTNQKLIYNGKIITKNPKSKLKDFEIKSGCRIMLMSNTSKEEKQKSKRRNSTKKRSAKILGTNDQFNLKPEIIEKGPPQGCMQGSKTPINIFPSSPFSIYDMNGNEAKLSVESEAMWVQPVVGDPERIFLTDIKSHKIIPQDIGGYNDQYVSIGLETKDGPRMFYFIPKQFSTIFENFLKGRNNDY